MLPSASARSRLQREDHGLLQRRLVGRQEGRGSSAGAGAPVSTAGGRIGSAGAVSLGGEVNQPLIFDMSDRSVASTPIVPISRPGTPSAAPRRRRSEKIANDRIGGDRHCCPQGQCPCPSTPDRSWRIGPLAVGERQRSHVLGAGNPGRPRLVRRGPCLFRRRLARGRGRFVAAGAQHLAHRSERIMSPA